MNPPAPISSPSPSQPISRHTWLWILLITTIFSGFSTYESFRGEGFLEADACTHYIYARKVWNSHRFLADVWGRPLCTGLYAIPAHLAGRYGVHAMSLALALITAWFTMSIARRQGYRWPVLAYAFTLAQPMVFMHSFSELTELPFAAVLAGAFLAYQRRWWWIMALLVGLLPLGRPEGFGFIALAGLALVAHRRLHWLPLLVLPLGLWSYAGWTWTPAQPNYPWWQWLEHAWPWDSKSTYDAGPLLKFVALLPFVVSPFLLPATCIGIWVSLRQGMPLLRLRLQTHRVHCQWLIAVLPLLVLVAHSLLYWLGKMASNGEPRYMLSVTPFWALLTAQGWEWIFIGRRWRWPLPWATAAVLLPWLANKHYQALPLRPDPSLRAARDFLQWYDHSTLQRRYPHLMTSHIAFFSLLSDYSNAPDLTVEFKPGILADAPPGTLLVWDSIYSLHNSDGQRIITLDAIQKAGWSERTDLAQRLNAVDDEPQWHVFLSPRSISPGE